MSFIHMSFIHGSTHAGAGLRRDHNAPMSGRSVLKGRGNVQQGTNSSKLERIRPPIATRSDQNIVPTMVRTRDYHAHPSHLRRTNHRSNPPKSPHSSSAAPVTVAVAILVTLAIAAGVAFNVTMVADAVTVAKAVLVGNQIIGTTAS